MLFDSQKISDWQMFIFETPYDYFEDNLFARQLLCDSWAMKLRGYKKYFPYGVLPIDHLDFIATNIVCAKKDQSSDSYIPLMGVKNLTLEKCNQFNLEFPIFKHLFCGETEKYAEHIKAIENWSLQYEPKDISYSMGFTIEPTLKKDDKKILTELGWAIFYLFYNDYNISNVIHGVSKTFKLAEKSKDIGFEYLNNVHGRLPSVTTKTYNDVESEVMTLNLNNLNDEFIIQTQIFENLWNNRMVITKESEEKIKKSA